MQTLTKAGLQEAFLDITCMGLNRFILRMKGQGYFKVAILLLVLNELRGVAMIAGVMS